MSDRAADIIGAIFAALLLGIARAMIAGYMLMITIGVVHAYYPQVHTLGYGGSVLLAALIAGTVWVMRYERES